MSKPPPPTTESNAPFGTEPRRSNTPIYVLGVLYALWFGVLVWMAYFHRST